MKEYHKQFPIEGYRSNSDEEILTSNKKIKKDRKKYKQLRRNNESFITNLENSFNNSNKILARDTP